MRKIILLVVVFSLTVATAVAQSTDDGVYIVQPGDSLWNLAGIKLDDPMLWGQVVAANPFLDQPGRLFNEDGKIIVLIRPGEELQGLEELTEVIPVMFPDVLPFSQVQMPAPPTQADSFEDVFGSEDSIEVVYTPGFYIPSWVWLTLAVILAILLVIALIKLMLGRDPATARDPIVKGGIPSIEEAQEPFRQMAQRRYGGDHESNSFRILESTSGSISGIMSVRYKDGRNVPRQMENEPAYEAKVEFPDRSTGTLYMLQACGNDLTYGPISRYLPGKKFTFTPDEEEVEVEERVIAPKETDALSQAETESVVSTDEGPASKQEPSTEDATVHFVRATAENPQHMISIGSDCGSFTFRDSEDGSIVFRWRNTSKKKVGEEASA